MSAMTNEEAALMHLAQAKLYFERGGQLQEANSVMRLIRQLDKSPKKASA